MRMTVDSKATEIVDLALCHHARGIRLIGSAAQGTDSAESDADFLVDFTADASILDVVHLRLRLEELLGCPVDVVPVGGLKERDVHLIEDSIPV